MASAPHSNPVSPPLVSVEKFPDRPGFGNLHLLNAPLSLVLEIEDLLLRRLASPAQMAASSSSSPISIESVTSAPIVVSQIAVPNPITTPVTSRETKPKRHGRKATTYVWNSYGEWLDAAIRDPDKRLRGRIVVEGERTGGIIVAEAFKGWAVADDCKKPSQKDFDTEMERCFGTSETRTVRRNTPIWNRYYQARADGENNKSRGTPLTQKDIEPTTVNVVTVEFYSAVSLLEFLDR